MTRAPADPGADPAFVTAAEAVASARWRAGRRLRDHGIVLSLLAMVVALSVSTDTFLTAANLVNLLDQAAVVGLLACGATLCLVAGVFDLSMSAVLALSAVVAVMVTRQTGLPLGAVAAVATGALLGAVNGIVVTRVGVHSFIATLALSVVYRGLGVIITAGMIVYPLERQLHGFQVLAWPTVLGGITVASVLFVVVAAGYCSGSRGRCNTASLQRE